MNKKGFVLLETITAITILTVILTMLFVSYNTILIKVKTKSHYDNVEYLYKTNYIRDYIRNIVKPEYEDKNVLIVCQNSDNTKKCYDDSTTPTDDNYLYKFLKVQAVYITLWKADKLSLNDLNGLEATTQNYIKSLDTSSDNNYRIICMFDEENNSSGKTSYEYASLKYNKEN